MRPPVRPPLAQSRAAAIDLATKDAIGERCGVAGSEEVEGFRRGGRAKGPKLMNWDSGSASARSWGFWDALIHARVLANA